mgnify:CR=1 FL=1|jgi:hypothetical protein
MRRPIAIVLLIPKGHIVPVQQLFFALYWKGQFLNLRNPLSIYMLKVVINERWDDLLLSLLGFGQLLIEEQLVTKSLNQPLILQGLSPGHLHDNSGDDINFQILHILVIGWRLVIPQVNYLQKLICLLLCRLMLESVGNG